MPFMSKKAKSKNQETNPNDIEDKERSWAIQTRPLRNKILSRFMKILIRGIEKVMIHTS